MKWLSKRQKQTVEIGSPFIPVEKIGEMLTPNLRALRLAMTISDLLLSMGVAANSTVSKALDVTETYCDQPVHIDIISNLLLVSQLRGVEKEPLTLYRPIANREANHMMLQMVQNLVHDIHEGAVTLDQAEERLADIIKNPKKMPWWLTMLGNASVVAGVALMYTSSWRVILTVFVIGLFVDRVLYALGKKTFPMFFRQASAAAFVTIAAGLVNLMAKNGFSFFYGMNPTLIVVSGIVMLVAGLAVVGAIQDAIEEYYLTANARLTKVILQTVGIIIGIMIGLYTLRKLGVGIAVSADPLTLNDPQLQVIGAAIASAGYALSTQTRLLGIIGTGLIGGITLSIMYSSVHWFGVSVVPASGIAAAFVGLAATFVSRFWRTPSTGIITAGIVPLVPGLMLYTGLMQLINYPPGSPLFFKALGTLFAVASTGLAIAAGATLGSMIGRPLNQKITHTRNVLPFIHFMRRQLRLEGRKKLASVALSQSAEADDDSTDQTHMAR